MNISDGPVKLERLRHSRYSWDPLTCAIPPTNLVFTTTLSSSALSKAAFWAARTRLSDARFTALPAAWRGGKKHRRGLGHDVITWI